MTFLEDFLFSDQSFSFPETERVILGHKTFSAKPRKVLGKLGLSQPPYFLSTTSTCQTPTSSIQETSDASSLPSDTH